jgi:16S rRNA (cytosine1402-N4)-methyltransferase
MRLNGPYEAGYHQPVMVKEVLDYLIRDKKGFYIDATFGGGGHSRKILEILEEGGYLVGIDQDEEAQAQAAGLLSQRFSFVLQNFEEISKVAREWGKEGGVDGILADLGVSMRQLREESRGFSYKGDSRLDMRMGKSIETNAREILNTYSFNALSRMFYRYGELKNANAIASAIIDFRQKQPIQTSGELNAALKKLLPPVNDWKALAPIYQAIRIEVNRELDALQNFLCASLRVLKAGGVLAVISYHSLEDRLVKKFFLSGNFEGVVQKDFFGNPIQPWRVLTRKPITPSQEELRMNTSARSAKLRAAVKV